jgi:hypothetical protein
MNVRTSPIAAAQPVTTKTSVAVLNVTSFAIARSKDANARTENLQIFDNLVFSKRFARVPVDFSAGK